MSSSLMLDVGQANELKLAFRRAGFNNDDIKRLCEGNILVSVRSVLRGSASISVISPTWHIIDCDHNPHVPHGWSIEEHKKGGELPWSKEVQRDALYVSPGQKGALPGEALREELESQPVLNATVLDFLLAHPHLIPEEWKSHLVFFWGTVYRYGELCVRCLHWNDREWASGAHWIKSSWNSKNPAAIRAD